MTPEEQVISIRNYVYLWMYAATRLNLIRDDDNVSGADAAQQIISELGASKVYRRVKLDLAVAQTIVESLRACQTDYFLLYKPGFKLETVLGAVEQITHRLPNWIPSFRGAQAHDKL